MTAASALTTAPGAGRRARVAIVCRADQAAGEATPRLVEQLGLEPVILPASPVATSGNLLERLDRLRDLDFAILLLSAEQLAATPEVMLEIGFLLGSLGRGRVCFVLQGKPALAPDLDGVAARLAMDEGGLWRLLLAREMKQAGLEVDLNRAM